MSTVIKVENLSKKYVIGHQRKEQYQTLRDALVTGTRNVVKAPLQWMKNEGAAKCVKEEFWALNDVSFEVNEGDRIGIIGRNGAGKSTLLKILSRITEPTKGRIKIRGRMASLLEVGTGFHPELTGRENIYLNGAILGMSRTEVQRKFDEIVNFAEIERFLDTPVKRYSSGMYVRLAFAVAAHLESEILIVDEVLAVGDAQFQKKCLEKMEGVSRGGRTVLFVSHNMNAVELLCNSVVMLERGKIVMHTTGVREAIVNYLTDGSDFSSSSDWVNEGGEFENEWFTPYRMQLLDSSNRCLIGPIKNTDDFWIHIEAKIKNIDPALTIGYAIYTEDGVPLYWSYQTDRSQSDWPDLKPGEVVFRSKIPTRLLNEGTYRIELLGGLHCREWLFEPGQRVPSLTFAVSGGISESPYWVTRRPTILAPVLDWEIKQ